MHCLCVRSGPQSTRRARRPPGSRRCSSSKPSAPASRPAPVDVGDARQLSEVVRGLPPRAAAADSRRHPRRGASRSISCCRDHRDGDLEAIWARKSDRWLAASSVACRYAAGFLRALLVGIGADQFTAGRQLCGRQRVSGCARGMAPRGGAGRAQRELGRVVARGYGRRRRGAASRRAESMQSHPRWAWACSLCSSNATCRAPPCCRWIGGNGAGSIRHSRPRRFSAVSWTGRRLARSTSMTQTRSQ